MPNDAEIRALLSVALMAALADGDRHDLEREALRAMSARLGEGRIDLADVYDDVLLRKRPLGDVVRPLESEALRRQAYEAAVAVADADGTHTPGEGAFLRDLAAALALSPQAAQAYVADADRVVEAAGVPAAGAQETFRTSSGTLLPDEAELDTRIVNASITNAALELLPETLASMAILPLQVRLVYRIGRAYGYELDQGHIKEFIATLGAGLTGQYLEQFGRKLLGGVLGSVLGGAGRAIGRQAASSGMAFATTWAIGQLAKQYYGGGRTLDATRLKATFAPLYDRGRAMITQYAPAIERRAATIDVRRLPELIRES
jgi:uncharacterized protein (DUF697 family)/tellurite resistance protein